MVTNKRIGGYEKEQSELLPNLCDYVASYATSLPDETALIDAITGEHVSWQEFDCSIRLFAAVLCDLGLKKGDIVVTFLPFTLEHVYLMYACHALGLIVCPLDLRMRYADCSHILKILNPRASFFIGWTEKYDFRPLVSKLMAEVSYSTYWIQCQKSDESKYILDQVSSIQQFVFRAQQMLALHHEQIRSKCENSFQCPEDPTLIICTSGSTGKPKAALISQRNILAQCLNMKMGFGLCKKDKILVNLPPSHVGGLTELLASAVFSGSTAVILPMFDAKYSLASIQKYKISVIGQIPSVYRLEWQLASYDSFDLSSLRLAVFGGQPIDRHFLKELQQMCPHAGTGFGMTELAGFGTFKLLSGNEPEGDVNLGLSSSFCPVSIRAPFIEDGQAGAELAQGDVGEICFAGLQVFCGYFNDSESTRQVLSKDFVLYTGDLGRINEKGELIYCGRRKRIIKPAGHQVSSEEIELHVKNYFSDLKGGVAAIGVVHPVRGEAIILFVEVMVEIAPSSQDFRDCFKELASFKHPQHVEIVEPGSFPLNNMGKPDYQALQRMADEIVSQVLQIGVSK